MTKKMFELIRRQNGSLNRDKHGKQHKPSKAPSLFLLLLVCRCYTEKNKRNLCYLRPENAQEMHRFLLLDFQKVWQILATGCD